MKLAKEMGKQLEFGASVAGGIPAIIATQEGLAGDRLYKIAGILNGTCNYILTQMESHGASFADALKEAQSLGFAEADPTSDVEGYDARAKLVILAQAGLRLNVRSEQIPCLPISLVEAIDFLYAREIGCTIRQISLAQEGNRAGQIQFARRRSADARAPVFVDRTCAGQPESRDCHRAIRRSDRAVRLRCRRRSHRGRRCFRSLHHFTQVICGLAVRQGRLFRTGCGNTQKKVSGEFTLPHYLRFVVNDRPGIIADIAAVLSRFDIGIDAVVQKPGYPRTALPFIITLEACSSAVLDRALAEIARLDFHVHAPLCLPILPQ